MREFSSVDSEETISSNLILSKDWHPTGSISSKETRYLFHKMSEFLIFGIRDFKIFTSTLLVNT